ACLVLFFFFQAEDGIRDPLVTGVQTCALPICRVRRLAARGSRRSTRGGRAPSESRDDLPEVDLVDQRVAAHLGRCALRDDASFEIGRASCRERVWVGVGERGVKTTEREAQTCR